MSSSPPVVLAGMTSRPPPPPTFAAPSSTARARGLRVAVRATGHGTFAEPSPDTLLIDTSRMRSVLVDPDRRTARVGPGATWGDVIEAAAPFGLAPVSGTNATVGVTGFTFGGGHGFLSRKYGLAADNLIRADVVTADGETLTAREDRRSGLFWALRGAGGNFGVATSLEFRLHPVREVFGGVASFDRGLAPHLLARFREYAHAGGAERLGRGHARRGRAARRLRRRRRRRLARARAAVPRRAVQGHVPRDALQRDGHDRRHRRRGASSCCATCRSTRSCAPPRPPTRSRSSAGAARSRAGTRPPATARSRSRSRSTARTSRRSRRTSPAARS